MASTKNKLALVALLIVAFQTISIAQNTNDWGWNWKDSSVVPTDKKAQYYEFLNNQYPYPPKPRNQWELSIALGHAFIAGDFPFTTSSKTSTGFARGAYNGGFTAGLSLRKAITHVFSLRGAVQYVDVHVPYYMNGGSGVIKPTFNYNKSWAFSLDGIVSLNTISNYRGNPKSNVYLLGGYSLVSSAITQKQKDATGAWVDQPWTGVQYPHTISESISGNKLTMLYHALDLGGGVAFKLNKKLNLGIEDKVIIPLSPNDYLDGYKGGASGDFINTLNLKLNINL